MKHPPYHLRTNKAVDRLLLVDVIRALETSSNSTDFTYYSLAGPFLEDLRVMDHFFPKMRLISLESNEQTFARQKFHLFNSKIELHNRNLTDFVVNHYEPGSKDIFWLDYTNLKYPHFGDFKFVLEKVSTGSIVRITLRAEPEIDLRSLENRISDEELKQVTKQMEDTFEKEFQKVLPKAPPGAFANSIEFARMVQLMIQRAASSALDTQGSKVDFLPVQCTRYNDNTQMLSVTGIVCLRDDMESIREKFRAIPFANLDWSMPDEINLPALSIKECLRLEHHLPIKDGSDAGRILLNELGYHIGDNEKSTVKQLSEYASYYREYPNFIRIAI